ncbi:MAG: Hcp family type VI secretion system effector [Beijerinckiaceae bacterium]
MAVDMFLEIDGVQGESAIKTNAIDIDSWTFGMAQASTGHVATGSGAGKVNVQDIHINKQICKVSPTVMLKCCQGEHIKKAKITCRKAGGQKPLDYMVIDLEDVLISSVQVVGSNGNDIVSESMSINFSSFKVTYTPQQASGAAGAPVECAWDVAKNKKK